jgi:MFS family permease
VTRLLLALGIQSSAALRVLRLVRVLRLGIVLGRAHRTLAGILGTNGLGRAVVVVTVVVLLAGPAGLIGILLGRAAADRIGRNVSGGVSMALTGLAVTFAYGGTAFQLITGYLAAILASSAFAPPTGALGAELVPTRIRATLAGWVTFAGVLGAVTGIFGFGLLADATGGFDAAARTIGIVVAIAAAGFWLLPETRDVELEDLEAGPSSTD